MIQLTTSKLHIKIGETQVCDNLNIECHAGEVWGILGRNGRGKTTLLHTLAGLHPVSQGDIYLCQKNINDLSRKQIARQLGILLQHHEDSFPCSVIETVLSGRHPHIDQWQWESQKDYAIAEQALEHVQLSHLKERSINQLSGGERQRVAIATLLTQTPQIMLLDEPNSHLDLKYQIQILDLLQQHCQTQKKTLLMTLHDLNLAARYCDRLILLLGDGKILTGNTDSLLTEENLQKLYDHPVSRIETPSFPLFMPR